MKRFLLIIAIGLGLSLTLVSAQNGPMYGGEAIVEMLKGVNEVQVLINGFEYTYNADWLSGVKLEDANTVSFSRGRVRHSYDMRKITMIQDEGRYIKVWMK